MEVDTKKKTKALTKAFSAKSFDECIAQMAKHTKKPQAMLDIALQYVSPQTEKMNHAILSTLGMAWIGFRLDRGPQRTGKLRELDREFSRHPQADKFLKFVAGYMTGDDVHDRKIAGDVALLLMAKRESPRKSLSHALQEMLLEAP